MFRIRYTILMFGMIFVTAEVAFALQYARPDGTIGSPAVWQPDGTSSPASLQAATNEVVADEDASYALALDRNASMELSLTDVSAPSVDTGHAIHFRFRSIGTGGGSETCRVYLFQGATQISASAQESNRSGSYTTFTHNILESEAVNITDYTSLSFVVEASGISSKDGEEVRVTWLELEVPDASAATEPAVTTGSPSSIDTTTATLGGDVTDTGGDPVTERGAYWSTSSGFTPPGEGTPDSTTGGPWGTGGFTEPVISLPAGSQVYFISFAVNSIGSGYGSESSFFTEPGQASGVGFANVASTSMDITWSAGTGGATLEYVVIICQGSNPVSQPSDGSTYSAGTSAYDDGYSFGGGEYVVYAGTGISASINGLTAEITYHVAVYASAGSAGNINYQQDSPAIDSRATIAGTSAPTVSTLPVSLIDTTSATLGATVTDDGGDPPITSRGTVWDTSTTPRLNLLAENSGNTSVDDPYSHSRDVTYEGTLIYFAGYATNGTGTGYSSDGSFYTEPLQASTIGFANVADTAMRITWTAGTSHATEGATVNSIVIVKEASLVTQTPDDGDDTYSAGTSVFNDGTNLGSSEYVVFSGVGTQVDITGLTAEATYHVAVYASVGPNVAPITPINYQQDGAPAASQKTNAAAVLATLSSTLTVAAIETSTATLGATITSDGGGAIIERGTVWDTTSSPTTNAVNEGGTSVDSYTHGRTGLYEGTLIYYRGYADNSAGRAFSPAPGDSFYTEPVQASTVGFENVIETEMRITWSAGTSDATYGATVNSIVVVKQGGIVTQAPADGATAYSAGTSVFNNGTDLGGGEYVVFNGTGEQVDITGLTDGLTYYVAVYAYVGSGAATNYQQDGAATGTKATTGGGPLPPTLSVPTVSNVNTTTATLGATVDTNGGDPVTERGTVWDVLPAPDTTDNKTVQGSGLGEFTHSVSSLYEGTLIYYRGYASNSTETGYSPEDSFYTEPTAATGLGFPWVTHKYMSITGTAGTSDATYGAPVKALIVAKQGSAVTQSPVDGVEYTSANFGVGTDLGGSEFVVFSGLLSGAGVSGLSANTTYHVAVYAYVGSDSMTNYQQDSPATANETTGPLSHNDAHGITSCLTCHAMHDGFVPHDSEQITVCVDNCHSPGNPAEAKSNVSLHTADSGATIIDCGSCHDVHAYDFQTTDTHSGSVTALNISRIRWDTAKYETSWSTSGAVLDPALFQQRPAHFAFDETTYSSGPFNGICQSCHTRVTKHTNDGWDLDAGAAADNDHEKGSDCISCHAHESNFSGAGGGCTTCHSNPQDAADGGPTRRAVVGEFGAASHHVVGGTVTDDDCAVCHMESETDHKNNLVDLRNPDTGTAIPGFAQFSRANDNDFSDEPWVTNVQNLLCLKCHDADGATVSNFSGNALQPFSSNSRDVPNTFDQFDTGHAFFHPVRGAGSNPYCTSTATNGGYATMLPPWNQSPDEHNMISCFDCHMTSGHGSTNQRMLTVDIDFDDMMLGNLVTTTMGYPIRTFCFTCHDQAVYLDTSAPEDLGSGFNDHGGNRNNHRLDNNVLSCMGCHAGPYNQGGSTVPGGNGAAPGIIHGGSYTWIEGFASGNDSDFFVLGGYISGYYSTGSPAGKCGGGNCSHPGGKTY